MIRVLLAALLALYAPPALAQSLGQAPGVGYVPTSTTVNSWTWQVPAPGLPSIAAFTYLCNNTALTAVPTACPALTAIAPLGVGGSGTTLTANTPTPNGLFIGNAGNASVGANTSIGIGAFTLLSVTTGGGNIGLGNSALQNVQTGGSNIGIGINAGAGITGAGASNMAIGAGTLGTSTTASLNTAVGSAALNKATSGSNTAIGASALNGITTGSSNTAIGASAGLIIATGSNNSILGNCSTTAGLVAATANAGVICDGAGNLKWGTVSGVPAGTGTCPINTQVGSNTRGRFQLNGACAAGTVILTFALTAQNGWGCRVFNRTTPASTFSQTADTTTSVTFTGNGATTEVIVFSCDPY